MLHLPRHASAKSEADHAGSRAARIRRPRPRGRTTWPSSLPYGDRRRLEIARALGHQARGAPARRAGGRDEPVGEGRAGRT